MKDDLQKDLTAALKARDTVRVSTLRLLLSQIKNEEIARHAALAREDVLALVRRGIKTRRESVEQFERGARADLADKERSEIAILEAYLPRQMSREEIAAAAAEVVRELGAQGKKDMGRVMKTLLERHAGQIDGREASAAVSALLK
jgi:hypothetical protein